MTEGDIYKLLQQMVVESGRYSTEEKLEILRLLFVQEDLARSMEKYKEQNNEV